MRILDRALALLLLLLNAGVLADDDAETVVAPSTVEAFEVFHNPNPSEFVQRGELQLMSDGTAQYSPVGLQSPPLLSNSEVSESDSAEYTLVLRSLKSSAKYVLPVQRCRLNGDASAEETFVVYETEDGNVFHIDYDAGTSTNCQKGGLPVTPPVLTRALLRKRMPGPQPKLAAPPQIDTSTGKEQQAEPPKSFLAKYWYYLVPLAILLFMGGEEPQQEGNSRRG
ncbi:hypothetical protein GGF46_000241 [Coemansia sp. RSA 552]|nr:hypothetical protein GGF46_000241 [Coemansia sp. RSA 552]